MNKQDFLKKLEKNLSVLEESEIKDILEEYEQHIDMAMQGGISEEEALKEFGDLSELTAGILEAYHVKADYNKDNKTALDFDKIQESGKKTIAGAKKSAGKLGQCFGNLIMKIKLTNQKKMDSFKKVVGNKKTDKLQHEANHDSLFYRIGNVIKNFVSVIWACICWSCKTILKASVWCIKIIWNVFWLWQIGVFGIAMLFGILMLGFMLVLLFTGYPFVGVSIMTLGAIFVAIAGVLISYSLITSELKHMIANKSNKDKTITVDGKEVEGHA